MKDKFGNDLIVGAEVLMPTPAKGDLWDTPFKGILRELRGEMALVENPSEDYTYEIRPERLEVIP